MEKRPIGNTGVAVTPIMFGTSGLGNMPDTYAHQNPIADLRRDHPK